MECQHLDYGISCIIGGGLKEVFQSPPSIQGLIKTTSFINFRLHTQAQTGNPDYYSQFRFLLYGMMRVERFYLHRIVKKVFHCSVKKTFLYFYSNFLTGKIILQYPTLVYCILRKIPTISIPPCIRHPRTYK